MHPMIMPAAVHKLLGESRAHFRRYAGSWQAWLDKGHRPVEVKQKVKTVGLRRKGCSVIRHGFNTTIRVFGSPRP
jgi:hypothetical protein